MQKLRTLLQRATRRRYCRRCSERCERMFLRRVCALPSDLADAYLDDLKVTAEERLLFFERVALQRKQESGLTVK
jgi:hypothetical protein